MKKTGHFLAVIVILACLCACAPLQDDSDISKFISPHKYGSLMPDKAPSSSLDPNQKPSVGEEEENELHSAPKYTIDLPWELSAGYFISNEFIFNVPTPWRDNFSLQPQDRSTGEMSWRSFNFYFVEEETGIEVLLLRIDSLTSSFVDNRGSLGGDELGRSADESYCYLRMSNAINPGEDFLSGGAVYDIMLALNDPEQFGFQIVA